jgi:O-6-methylguanine DNA methyltransferase
MITCQLYLQIFKNMKKKHTIINETLSYTVFKNSFGLTGLAASQRGLIRLANKISNEKAFESILVKGLGFQIRRNPRHFDILIKQFQKYFRGELKSFKFPLDLRLGTPFQQKVWEALLTIPYGTTRSYKWLAQSIKSPKSARAVGNANGQNPLSIIIPCHRVIRENGELGGYTGGIQIKRNLLKLEKAIYNGSL